MIAGEADAALEYSLSLGLHWLNASFVPALNNFWHQRQLMRCALRGWMWGGMG